MSVEREPLCCGEPMVRYPGVAWECSTAYFRLLDDGAIWDHGDTPPVLNDSATDEHRALLAHLIATRIACDSGAE